MMIITRIAFDKYTIFLFSLCSSINTSHVFKTINYYTFIDGNEKYIYSEIIICNQKFFLIKNTYDSLSGQSFLKTLINLLMEGFHLQNSIWLT